MKEKIGFIGLGKLGLPCAAAISVEAQVEVFGYDLNPKVSEYVASSKIPYIEALCENYLERAKIHVLDSVEDVVANSSIIFLAIQTPHDSRLEGTSPISNEELSDFDYSYLEEAARSIKSSLLKMPNKEVLVVVISTVLPGTMRNRILPILEEVIDRVSFCYNPFFIAMGQTISDFLNPEFVLIGTDDLKAGMRLEKLYSQIHSAPVRIMQIESAELTKVAYNTFIGFKIVFANTMREITQSRGGNVDEVTSALSMASSRLMSGKYMSAGMGDGGGCHPRDQIAMSWLANEANLSSDVFGFLATARDNQSQRQADELISLAKKHSLPIVILGLAYKAGINLTVGSPSLLLLNQLEAKGINAKTYDPYIGGKSDFLETPSIFFIATNHEEFKEFVFPPNSVIVDPWGNIANTGLDQIVIRPGR